MKYYTDATGRYLGGWQGPVTEGQEQPHPDTPAGAVEVPVPPESASDIWDGTAWVPDLAFLKTTRKRLIKDACRQALAGGYLTNAGITMDAGPEHVRLLDDGYRLAVRLNQTTMDIRDYNNQVHMAVPIADVEAMVTELALNVQAQLAKKWSLEQQIDAAATVAEVDAVVWS